MMSQGREVQPKQRGALKGHETQSPVAPSFKKEGLEGDAMCKTYNIYNAPSIGSN